MYKNNLWCAILAVFGSYSVIDFLLNIDRLGNAICSGHYKTTISGRVGYFSLKKKNRYWIILEWVINETFRPIEGRKHCLRAYQWERGKGLSHRRGSDLALGLLSIFIIAACLILAPLVWLWSLTQR
jgi:hypothetical protein